MELGRVRQNGEREVIELTGEGGVGTTHQTVYTRKRTGVQGEKTERSIGCYSASSQDTACQRSYHLHLRQAWNSHGAWRLPKKGSLD